MWPEQGATGPGQPSWKSRERQASRTTAGGVCGRPCRQEAHLELPQRACALRTLTPSKSNLGHGLKNGPKGPTTETEAHKRSDGGDSNWEGRGGGDRGLVGLTQGADTPAT